MKFVLRKGRRSLAVFSVSTQLRSCERWRQKCSPVLSWGLTGWAGQLGSADEPCDVPGCLRRGSPDLHKTFSRAKRLHFDRRISSDSHNHCLPSSYYRPGAQSSVDTESHLTLIKNHVYLYPHFIDWKVEVVTYTRSHSQDSGLVQSLCHQLLCYSLPWESEGTFQFPKIKYIYNFPWSTSALRFTTTYILQVTLKI